MVENLETNQDEKNSIKVSLRKDAVVAELLHQSVQIRATLTTLLNLQSEIFAHMKGATSDDEFDQERDKWFAIRDGLAGSFGSQLKDVDYIE